MNLKYESASELQTDRESALQGHLTHIVRHVPCVGSYGDAVSYERGTPVAKDTFGQGSGAKGFDRDLRVVVKPAGVKFVTRTQNPQTSNPKL